MRRSWGSPFGDSTGDRMLLPAGLHHAFTHARSRAPHTATREVDASACHATLTDMGYTAEDAALGAQLFGRELPAAVSFLSQLHRLLEMGFDRPAVEAALQKSRDPEDVLQLLLGGASTPSGATSPAPLQSSALPAPPAQPAPPAPQRLDAATIAELTARRAALKAQLEASMLLAQPSPADTERSLPRSWTTNRFLPPARPMDRRSRCRPGARAAADAAAADTAVAGRVETWRLLSVRARRATASCASRRRPAAVALRINARRATSASPSAGRRRRHPRRLILHPISISSSSRRCRSSRRAHPAARGVPTERPQSGKLPSMPPSIAHRGGGRRRHSRMSSMPRTLPFSVECTVQLLKFTVDD